MIPDARLFAPADTPKCDCLKRTQAANYRAQYSCEECEALLEKIERMSSDQLIESANALIESMNDKD